ncbi:hypothetical protein CHU95_06060 [Niveispirillum lacus]|uniref:ChbG/HpnK family deacetylase n=1 Tax=Niveispirillum lacus TaxID=1981099 RepID=A0A255Z4J3_9PROT|nr:ChbG/HpnK family deacetylase [Niveispirillum lacus]OYQ35834.1 hypothetical protein CHU95_06060 [Niveispirillum lacus]
MPHRLIRVIADDYALSPGVSQAILELANAGRLSGTGVMVPSPFWQEQARRLHDTPGHFQTGLHLTLTGAFSPLGNMPTLCPHGRFPSLRRWFFLSYAGLLSGQASQEELSAEITRQLDAFETTLGRAPHFIDGHQHMHLIPGIRSLVLGILARRYPAGSVWVRDCAEPAGRVITRGVGSGKALFIAWLARGLGVQAAARSIPTNTGFSGVYGFHGEYARMMDRFLHGLPSGAVIMVHPARPDPELATLDPVVDARGAEMAYLAGPDWPAALSRAGIVIF